MKTKILKDVEYVDKENVTTLISEILWMARRYADGRKTYAVSMFNDTYDDLRDLLGDGIDQQTGDATIKNYPYATDGQFGLTHSKYLKGKK